MRKIIRDNKTLYKYEKRKITSNILVAIIFYIIAILLFVGSILIAYVNKGEGSTILGGFGLVSIFLDIMSISFIVYDIYQNHNFQPAIRNMLLLQIIYLIMWVFII